MIYLGVDGGGTSTAFMLIDGKGEILSHIITETCHYLQVGFDGYRLTLKEGIMKVCQRADIHISQIDFAFFGIPCFGEKKEDIPLLEKIPGEILKSDNYQCGNDVEAGWAGSLACKPGINIVAGTGAIGFARDKQGNTARASGWGYFCGDEGSAYWLGKQLISLFTKQADGRLPQTPLYEIVRDQFNLKRDLDLISVIYDRLEQKRDKIAALALLVYQAAEAGDQKAVELYHKAAREFSLTVNALIDELQFNKRQEVLVSYSGGVFKAGKYILESFKNNINRSNVELIKPILKPVTGAALYAYKLGQKVGNTDNMKHVVRNLQQQQEMRGIN